MAIVIIGRLQAEDPPLVALVLKMEEGEFVVLDAKQRPLMRPIDLRFALLQNQNGLIRAMDGVRNKLHLPTIRDASSGAKDMDLVADFMDFRPFDGAVAVFFAVIDDLVMVKGGLAQVIRDLDQSEFAVKSRPRFGESKDDIGPVVDPNGAGILVAFALQNLGMEDIARAWIL